MMKVLLFLFAVLFGFNSHAQENWMYIQTELDSENNGISDVIPIVNENSSELFLFLREKRNGIAYIINDKKEILSELNSSNFPAKAHKLVGHTFNKKKYTLYFANTTQRRYSCVQFDFESNTSNKIDEIKLPLKKESSVEHFSDGDRFYILTSVRSTSKLKLYSFDVDGNYDEKIIDLSGEVFETSRGLKIPLYNLIFAGSNTTTTNKVEVGEPIPLETAKADNKLYFRDGKITLTSDYLDRYTYIIDIDIDTSTYNLDRFEHKNFNKDRLRTKSNSFIYDEYFFNMYASRKQLDFLIYNRQTKEIINQFTVTDDSEINFKNSPIILEGGDFANYRELEQTKQFLRKIIGSDIALSVYKNQDKYIVTLGASKELAGGYYIPGGGVIGGLISGALYSTFSSYSKTKSTRINCLFDQDFNHVKGPIPKNSFDKIDTYSKNIKKPNAETIFKYKDNYVWGSYIKNSRVYRLVKF